MEIIDFVGYTFSGGIIILYVMEKAERVVRIIKLMFEEQIDEAVTIIKKSIPKKKKTDELEV
ncbi:hypothetical protein LAV73_06495 [Lysinibacillus xylanilyticus]|uniref:hypothetical protein n=1 Tax=Lysinibacillus xylanilyticus TaxID=582475 RepID=UPI002B256407|nr:hypothetical protein [Lysinibacillus xylanilyticus]MEB2279649.1 hypothetical protein [Lysinibacillus xylanilyticus]